MSTIHNERTALESANITVGRRDWDKEGRLLGAGVSAGPTVSELGLSANPKAMGHGVIQPSSKAPPAPPSSSSSRVPAAAAAPAGDIAAAAAAAAATIPDHVKQHGPGVHVTGAADARPVQDAQRVITNTTTYVNGKSVGSTRTGPAAAAMQQQQGQVSNTQSSSSQVEAGRAQRVAPQQQSVFSTAFQRLKQLLFAPPDVLALGPPWTKWPDFDRLNNINALLAGLWPTLSDAVEQQIVMQMAPQMMAQAAKDYGAGYLTGLKLLHFDLGKIPPRLDGIKVYEENISDEQLMMEVAFSWGSNLTVSVGATLQLLGHTFSIPLTISNIQVHAITRLSASPMIPSYPYVGAVGVSLIEPPHVDFDLPVAALGGLDLMALPMVRGAFRHAVKLASRQFIVFPKGIQIPLVPSGAAAAGPVGMLEIKLVRLAGLRSEDLTGHSDPYVILRVREGREVRSRTVSNNNNPEYNQNFKLLVEDLDTQVLQIIVMDEDLIKMQNKVMGVAQVPLKESACVKMPKTKVPVTLNIHKLMAPQQGIGGILELPIRVAGLPVTAAAKAGQFVYGNLAGALGGAHRSLGNKGSTGGQYTRVLDETGWLGPSEEYLKEQGVRNPAAAAGTPEAAAAAEAPGQQQQQQQPEEVVGHAAPALAVAGAAVIPSGGSSSILSDAAGAPSTTLKVHPVTTPPSGSSPFTAAAVGGSSSSSRPVRIRRPSEGNMTDDYDAAQKISIGDRLSSQSAPLTGVYGAEDGSSSCTGQQQQQQQQQEQDKQQQQQDEQQQQQRESVASVQSEMAAGKDAKNLEANQIKPIYRGTAFLELTYIPFKQPDVPPTGAGASPAAAHISARDVQPTDMGILTVTVVRAKGLSGWSGEPDPYVTLSIMQNGGEAGSHTASGTSHGTAAGRLQDLEEMRSQTIYNEDSPRWNEKFDFIMIPASSVLLITVWDQTSVMESIASLQLSRERFKNQVMGRVKVPVLDVAAAGRLRSTWPLQGALMGELELVLQWIPAEMVK